jgi:hypothetical protein
MNSILDAATAASCSWANFTEEWDEACREASTLEISDESNRDLRVVSLGRPSEPPPLFKFEFVHRFFVLFCLFVFGIKMSNRVRV